MAPYLLLGFTFAGILSELVRAKWVRRWLGKQGLSSILKATLVGVPMPLCSCSVIPVAASLRSSGASKGATAAFLTSTPQTGVDSVLATYGLMGPLFAAARVVAAFISGVLTGILVEITPSSSGETNTSIAKAHPENSAAQHSRPSLLAMLRFGFYTLPLEIGRSLAIGMLIGGALSALLPIGIISENIESRWLLYPLVVLIATPMYICSTGSIPVAFSLMHGGLSAGAALVFLVAGPATNAATVATMWKVLGRRETIVYLTTLVLFACGFGALFDFLASLEIFREQYGQFLVEMFNEHEHGGSPLQIFSSWALAAILMFAFFIWALKKKKCSNERCE
jgi:hypothetical protein